MDWMDWQVMFIEALVCVQVHPNVHYVLLDHTAAVLVAYESEDTAVAAFVFPIEIMLWIWEINVVTGASASATASAFAWGAAAAAAAATEPRRRRRCSASCVLLCVHMRAWMRRGVRECLSAWMRACADVAFSDAATKCTHSFSIVGETLDVSAKCYHPMKQNIIMVLIIFPVSFPTGITTS